MRFYHVRTKSYMIIVKIPENETDDISFVKQRTKEIGLEFILCYKYPWSKGDKEYV